MASILDNPSVRRFAWTMSVEQYHRLGQSGIVSERTELLRGYVVEKINKSPTHSFLVEFLQEWLRENSPDAAYVRQEQPLTFTDSEPEPDLALVAGRMDDYRDAHPRSALLVVEVAVSSADIDYEKAAIYAEAGIPEYVIVLADERRVELLILPETSGYAQRIELAASDRLSLTSLPGVELELRRLFP